MPTDCHPGGRNGELLRARTLVPFRGSCIARLDGKESSTKSRGNTYTGEDGEVPILKICIFEGVYPDGLFPKMGTGTVAFGADSPGLWDCPVHCRMFTSVPGLCPLDASFMNRPIFRHCHLSPEWGGESLLGDEEAMRIMSSHQRGFGP